jgi:hypothetical protein
VSFLRSLEDDRLIWLGHAAVDAFHQAALAAGGKCNGPPGPRADYHPEYYGAFVLDPLGNNVEVVGRGLSLVDVVI